jgi:hypothetical protein
MRRKPLEAKNEVMRMRETKPLEAVDREKALEAFMAESSMTANTGPRMLPVIDFDGKLYFIDERLKQLRSVADPSDRIDF